MNTDIKYNSQTNIVTFTILECDANGKQIKTEINTDPQTMRNIISWLDFFLKQIEGGTFKNKLLELN